MTARLTPPAIDEATYERLARRIYEASGIHVGERQRGVLEARVRARLQQAGLQSAEAYEQRLRGGVAGEEELDRLLDVLAVHESYFFREESQLQLMVRRLIPDVLAVRAGEPVRIWSAGCAAGHEPYSLVMMLEEAHAWREGAFDISGTDFSPSCLEQARRAVYTPAALRDTSMARKARFFRKLGAEWALLETLRDRVRFQRLNLYRERSAGMVGRFDIILCRNVLLYFDPAARAQVVEMLKGRLRPGGWLLVGRTETLLNVRTALEAREMDGEVAYQRIAGGRT